MSRLTRNYAVLAKIETTYGTDSIPTGGANAISCTNLTINSLNATNVARNLVRPYFGASEELIGVANKEISFDVELVGSGTAGTAPAWGPLLRACLMAEVNIATTRSDYTPITTGAEGVTIYAHKDGVLHKLLGARGEWSLSAKTGDIPKLTFRFQGLDGGDTAVANPSVTLTAWQTPQVITNAFTPNFVLGGTVSSTGAPAITGGTTVPSTGLVLQSGNQVNFSNMIGLQEIDITDRQVTGTVELDLTAAQEVSRMADVKGNVLTSMSMLHGTQAGRKVLIHLPSVQLTSPSQADMNGRMLMSYTLRAVPVAGNDEIRIVTSF